MEGIANGGLILTYILFVIAAIGSVALPLYTSIKNDPKSLLPVGRSIGILIALFLVGYLIASGSDAQKFVEKGINITESTSKSVGGLINMTYILTIVSALGIVYFEFIHKLVRK